jgi:hypothetical protein
MPLGGAAAGVKRSALMYVAAVMTCSSFRSPRMLAIIADTFSPVLICSTARYLSTPQRAMHSSSSSKSRVVSSTAPPPSFCALTKAALHCGTDRRHLNSVPTRSSPTMSEPCVHVNVPMTLSACSVEIHCVMPTFWFSSSGMVANHACRRGRPSASAACTSGICIVLARNSPASSRCALGRMFSLSARSRHCGTGSSESWCSIVSSPYSGLSRMNETRVSTFMNSYMTSSELAAGPAMPLPLLSALVNCSFIIANVYGWPLLVSRPTSMTKSWNSSMSIVLALSSPLLSPSDLQ